MKERFIEFLEKNKCLNEFKSNINKGKDFDEHCNENWDRRSVWIDRAFTWSATPQNHAYWSKLNSKWVDLVRKYRMEDELQ